MTRIVLLVAAIACLQVAPRRAEACSPPVCTPGGFVPADLAQVPANLPGLVWRPTANALGDPADPSSVVLATADDPATPRPFTATPLADGDFVLVPDAPLDAGVTYVVRDASTCGDTPGPTVTFTTTAAANPPSTLGTMTAAYTRGPLEVATASGSCSAPVDAAIVDLDVALADDARPWQDALLFETLVDGQPWRPSSSIVVRPPPGGSWTGRATDRLYRVCATDDTTIGEGLAAGPHEVTIRATLPGSDIVVTTQTVMVDLSCEGGVPPACLDDPALCGDDEPGGCSAGGGGAAPALGLVLVLGARRRRRRVA